MHEYTTYMCYYMIVLLIGILVLSYIKSQVVTAVITHRIVVQMYHWTRRHGKSNYPNVSHELIIMYHVIIEAKVPILLFHECPSICLIPLI